MEFYKEHRVFKISKLLALHESGKINLNPGFQRDSVWIDKERRLLIDTIFRRMPLPNIFLWERREKKEKIFDVIDGKQRLEAIIAFTRKRKPISVEFDPEGSVDWNYKDKYNWTWKEILEEEAKIKKQFNNYEIPTVVVHGNLSDIEKIFVRINSTGKKLTSQEIRHARWQNNDILKDAEKLARKHESLFLNLGILSKNQITRMKAVELVSEIMLSIHEEGVLDKKKAIDRLIGNNSIHGGTLRVINRETKYILGYIKKYLSDIKKTRFNSTSDFYALCFALWEMKNDGYNINDKDKIKMAYEVLNNLSLEIASYKQMTSEGKTARLKSVASDYRLTVIAGTDSKANRARRVKIIRSLIQSIFDKRDTLNLPRFDAHSLKGTIVPKESDDDKQNQKEIQPGIQTGSSAVTGTGEQRGCPVGAGIGGETQPVV